MKGARTGLLVGLALTVPVTFWLLAQAEVHGGANGALRATARQAAQTLVLLQALGAGLLAPWLTRAERAVEGVWDIAMLVAVPLPLFAVAWAVGAVGWAPVARSQASVLALGVTLYALSRAAITALPRDGPRALATALIQGLACVGIWASREAWLGWLGA